MADAISERIEEIAESKAREVFRNHELRIKALEEGTVAEINTPSEKWTKEELLAEAEKRGVTVASHATKAEILELLK